MKVHPIQLTVHGRDRYIGIGAAGPIPADFEAGEVFLVDKDPTELARASKAYMAALADFQKADLSGASQDDLMAIDSVLDQAQEDLEKAVALS